MSTTNDNPIHILLGSDDRYLPGAVVTMASSINASPVGTPFVFHLMDFGISGHNCKRLAEFFHRYPNVEVVVHDVDLTPFRQANAPVFSGGGGYAAYARLLAPAFLTEPKVIYIDTDIFIQKDLRIIWNLPLEGLAFAACLNTSKGGIPNCDKMSFDCPFSNDPSILTRPYFNSGLMVINLVFWRENDFVRKTLSLIQTDKRISFADQTIINYLASGCTKMLDPSWNSTPWWTRPVPPNVNLHFTSNFKPWTDRFFLPAEKIWFAFYDHEVKPHWDVVRTTRRKIRGGIRFLRFYGIPALFPRTYCALRKCFRKDSMLRRDNDLKQFLAMHTMIFHGLDETSRKTIRDYQASLNRLP